MEKQIDLKNLNSIPFFFIIGRARSGTTLLRTLFDAHPEVCIPIEAPIVVRMMDKYSQIGYWTKNTLEEFYKDLLQVRDFHKWKIDKEKLYEDLMSCNGQISYNNILKVVYLNFISLFPKDEIKLIGDKNPVYSISVRKIFKLFPDAKYIHLTRDYRDHIVSMLKAKLYTSSILFLAFRWRFSAIQIEKLKKKYGYRFLTVRYEDLAFDVEHVLPKIYKFLKINYDPDVINYHEKTQEVYENELKNTIEDHHKKVFQPIDTKSIGVWEDKLNDRQLKIADMVVGKYSELYGYERRYKKWEFGVWIRVAPGLLYEHISYRIKRMIDKMPLSWKSWIKKNFPQIKK